MSQHFAVERRLSPEHLAELRAMLPDPRVTIDEATAWLRGKGYKIGRTAVFNYSAFIKSQSPAERPAAESDVSKRRKLAALADQLGGESLTTLCQFAGFLLVMSVANGAFASSAPDGSRATTPGGRTGKGVSKVR